MPFAGARSGASGSRPDRQTPGRRRSVHRDSSFEQTRHDPSITVHDRSRHARLVHRSHRRRRASRPDATRRGARTPCRRRGQGSLGRDAPELRRGPRARARAVLGRAGGGRGLLASSRRASGHAVPLHDGRHRVRLGHRPGPPARRFSRATADRSATRCGRTASSSAADDPSTAAGGRPVRGVRRTPRGGFDAPVAELPGRRLGRSRLRRRGDAREPRRQPRRAEPVHEPHGRRARRRARRLPVRQRPPRAAHARGARRRGPHRLREGRQQPPEDRRRALARRLRPTGELRTRSCSCARSAAWTPSSATASPT